MNEDEIDRGEGALPAHGGGSDRATLTLRKKRYQSPCLIIFGDVRDLTLGPSAGIGESGNPLVFKA